MNIIKKVSIFVMGLVVIGVVSTAVGVTTQSKTVEKSVTFELLENNELAYNVNDTILDFSIIDNEVVVNLVSISVNDVYNNNLTINIPGEYIFINDEPYTYELEISTNNTYEAHAGFNVGDIITVTFDVEVKTPVIIKTLLVLIPLVLSASVIGYLVVKKGDE